MASRRAIEATKEGRDLVRRAGRLMAQVIQYLPPGREQERATAVAAVASVVAADHNMVDVPQMVGGYYAHQERLFDEAAQTTGGDRMIGRASELIDTWAHGRMPEVLQMALDWGLPSARTWAASLIAVEVAGALHSIISAQFVIRCYDDGGWDRDAAQTWGGMSASAHANASRAINLAKVLTAAAELPALEQR